MKNKDIVYQEGVSKALLGQNRQVTNIVNLLLSKGIFFDEVKIILLDSLSEIEKDGFEMKRSGDVKVAKLLLLQVAKSLKKEIEKIAENIILDNPYLKILMDVLIIENINSAQYEFKKEYQIKQIKTLLQELNPTQGGELQK